MREVRSHFDSSPFAIRLSRLRVGLQLNDNKVCSSQAQGEGEEQEEEGAMSSARSFDTTADASVGLQQNGKRVGSST